LESNSAVEFNGSDQRIDIPYSAALNPPMYSIEAWVQPSTLPFSGSGGMDSKVIIGSRSTSGDRRGYLLYIDDYSGHPQFAFSVGAGCPDNPRYVYDAVSTFPWVQTGVWYYVAATFDGSTLRLYVNGIDVTSKQLGCGSAFMSQTDQPTRIGMADRFGRLRYAFGGRIDEVAVYPRVLTETQILAHSLGKAVGATPSEGTVLVREQGTQNFVPLQAGTSIESGSEVDASAGEVQITSATPGGDSQGATASNGKFVVTQGAGMALTELRLSAHVACKPGVGTSVLRRLRVGVKGKFRTLGARGWAMPETLRATWLTSDQCVPRERQFTAATRGKRKKRTCYKNLSKRSEICVYDPEHRPHRVDVRPNKSRCV
jgi:hypothetical protein